MVVALLFLSLAMIVGGLASVVFGWDIVLSERGWTMVIAGSVAAGSGAILLGLAAVTGRLGRIRKDLASVHEELSRLGAPSPPLPTIDPVNAVTSALLSGAAGDGGPSAAPETKPDEAQPPLPLFMRPADAAEPDRPPADDDRPSPWPERPPAAGRSEPVVADDDGPAAADAARDLGVGEPGPASADRGPERPAVGPRDLPAAEPEDQADRAPPRPREADVVPSAVPLREREAARPEESAEPAETAPGTDRSAHVIGTYTSGDNRYVMFSDGSIEAETPEGVFRFDSLDELKEFIASGGESGSSAA